MKAVRGTERGRPLGLGALGFHTLLQSKMIPLDSVDAMMLNEEIFKHMKQEAERATKYLAEVLGNLSTVKDLDDAILTFLRWLEHELCFALRWSFSRNRTRGRKCI